MFFQITIFYVFLIELYTFLWPLKETQFLDESLKILSKGEQLPTFLVMHSLFTIVGTVAYIAFAIIAFLKASTPLSYGLWLSIIFLHKLTEKIKSKLPNHPVLASRIEAALSIGVIVAFIATL